MIVAFGEALVDLFALPLGTTIEAAASFAPCLGGAPANVAVVLGRLGIPTRFVGAVGRDAHGTRLADGLFAAWVDMAALVRVPQRTGITFIHVADDGDRSFLFYRREGADFALTVDHLRAQPVHPLQDATWLHVSSSVLAAEPHAGTARWLLDEAVARGVQVALDINLRPGLWPDPEAAVAAVRELAPRAAWIKASEDDLQGLGLPASLDALTMLAPDAVPVLTLAERGACVRIAGETVQLPAPRVATVDATGAGDAFVAGVLSVLHRRGAVPGGPSWRDRDVWVEALRWGCALGARAVTAMGATTALEHLADFAPGAQEESHGV